MGQLTEGDVAPGFDLLSVEGKSISLKNLQDEKKTIVLVFLRHLG
jgi:peroxiredoxin